MSRLTLKTPHLHSTYNHKVIEKGEVLNSKTIWSNLTEKDREINRQEVRDRQKHKARDRRRDKRDRHRERQER